VRGVSSDFDPLTDVPRTRPLLDEVVGDGADDALAEVVHNAGSQINKDIDELHATDHGLRICNADDPLKQVSSERR